MAKYENGILGNFNGTVGSVVGASWRGIPYMRSKAAKTKRAPTTAQLTQRGKFAIAGRFISRINRLLMLVSAGRSDRTWANQVLSETIKRAIIGEYPSFEIDYSKVLISRGELFNANSPASVTAGNGIVQFNWQDNTDTVSAMADDQCILLAYCPEAGQCIYKFQGAQRNASSDELNLAGFAGKTVHTWITFRSFDGKRIATSIYAGAVVVA